MTSTSQLFIDKYRPTSFDDLKFNKEVGKKLKICSQSNQIPHIIIKGPNGCGKDTLANLFVMTKYDRPNLSIKNQTIELKHSSKPLSVQMLYSNYHYKLDPSQHSVYDKTIISGFIKDVIQTKPVDPKVPYHTIIIDNADKLTLEAQQSLRRTLEKCISNCRFVFIISQDCNLIEPLMSRCMNIRLSAPTNDDIVNILSDICIKENIAYCKSQLFQLAQHCSRNLNTAINSLQYLQLVNPQCLNVDNHPIDLTMCNDNIKYINVIVDLMEHCDKVTDILAIRNILFDLLVHCIQPLTILKQLFLVLIEKSEYKHLQHQLIQCLIKYENSLKLGSKPIYHLEGFVISALTLIKGFDVTITQTLG